MIRTVLRRVGIVLVVHGVLFAGAASLVAARGSLGFAAADAVYLMVLAIPALVLTTPFVPLLWRLRLMNTPGWYAFPRPLGVALAYGIWILLTLGLSHALPRPKGDTRE